MSLKKHIPNLFTLGNLTCGVLAIKLAFDQDFTSVFTTMLVAGLFDLLDGMIARILNVRSELGKQLDSLADMVSFGVVPAIVMYVFLVETLEGVPNVLALYIPYCAVIITLFSALRLAKFNIDEGQADDFIGLPTPANALFFISIPVVITEIGMEPVSMMIWPPVIVIFSVLLVSPIPMFALKFKTLGWKGNGIRWVFLLLCLCIILGCVLTSIWVVALPLLVLLYIILSIINNTLGKNEVQS